MQAAVERDGLAGGELGTGKEKNNELGHLGRGSEATHGSAVDDFLAERLEGGAAFGDLLGGDKAGQKRIDAHAGRETTGKILAQSGQGGLAEGEIGRAAIAADGAAAANVNDGAQRIGGGEGKGQGCTQVDREGGIETGGIEIGFGVGALKGRGGGRSNGIGGGEGGVIDEKIETAQALANAGNERGRGGRVGEVAGELALVAGVGGNPGTAAFEGGDDGGSDAAASAGDEGNLAGEIPLQHWAIVG